MVSGELTLKVNLSRVYSTRKTKRASRAIRYLREYLRKRFHAEEILIDEKLNNIIWSRGIEKPPRKLLLKVTIEETKEIETKKGEKIKIPKKLRVGVATNSVQVSQGGMQAGEKSKSSGSASSQG